MRGPHHNWPHRKARAWHITRTPPGTPCPYCHQPLTGPTTTWDLAHNDNKPGTYLGMTHRKCNRSRHKQSPHNKHKTNNTNNTDRETQRRQRINQREQQRQQRQQRRTIIVPPDDK